MDSPSQYTYNTLIEKHFKLIDYICRQYTTEILHIEDLRQECLIAIYSSIPRFKGTCNPSSWIYKVCLYTCLVLRKKATRYIKTYSIEDSAEIDNVIDEIYDLEHQAEFAHHILQHLKPLDKNILLLWLDDCSYEEISTYLAIPRNSVASKIHRLKKYLRKYFKPQ